MPDALGRRDGPSDPGELSRRRLLAWAAGGALGFGAWSAARADESNAPKRPAEPPATPDAGEKKDPARGPEPAALPTRPFGRTGARVSIVSLGCSPLGGLRSDEEAVRVVRRALDGGITYVDTAPSYGNGASERRVGLALAGRSKPPVVATKTLARTAGEARREVEASLRRLGLARVDLVQVHAISDRAELDAVLAPDGAVAGLRKARDEGLLRWIGVTGHRDPAVMRAAAETERFDAMLFPLNCVDRHYSSFEQETLPAAVEKGLARVAMKVFASGGLVQRGVEARACLRYVLGLDVATVTVGCATTDEVDLALDVARGFERLSEDQVRALLERTRPHRGRPLEWYKR
jgi:predicted aldo/keto reductase-like oxidoreductase